PRKYHIPADRPPRRPVAYFDRSGTASRRNIPRHYRLDAHQERRKRDEETVKWIFVRRPARPVGSWVGWLRRWRWEEAWASASLVREPAPSTMRIFRFGWPRR